MNARLPKQYWIDRLGLLPHPEGGYYVETFRSKRQVVPAGGAQDRDISTAIHYLLGSASTGQFSAWHRLHGLEESWYYHYGDDLLIHQIDPGGVLSTNRLGMSAQSSLQSHIPADSWFCAVVQNPDPAAYSLVSCAVQPGFEFRDFELAAATDLATAFPAHNEIIKRFCR